MISNDIILADAGSVVTVIIFFVIILFNIIASIADKKKKRKSELANEEDSAPTWVESWIEEEENPPSISQHAEISGNLVQSESHKGLGSALQGMFAQFQEQAQTPPPPIPVQQKIAKPPPKPTVKIKQRQTESEIKLSSVEELRSAIILAEILAPCKAKRNLFEKVPRRMI